MYLRIKINSKARLVRLSKIVISLTKKGLSLKRLKGKLHIQSGRKYRLI